MSVSERELMGKNARLTYSMEYTIEQFEKRFINVLSKYL